MIFLACSFIFFYFIYLFFFYYFYLFIFVKNHLLVTSDVIICTECTIFAKTTAKTAGLSDKTGKFSFCPAKIFGLPDSCPATLFNRQILIIDFFLIFFFFLKFYLLLPLRFWVKRH